MVKWRVWWQMNKRSVQFNIDILRPLLTIFSSTTMTKENWVSEEINYFTLYPNGCHILQEPWFFTLLSLWPNSIILSWCFVVFPCFVKYQQWQACCCYESCSPVVLYLSSVFVSDSFYVSFRFILHATYFMKYYCTCSFQTEFTDKRK